MAERNWHPPEWLVDALQDAMFGGDQPEFITKEEIRASGVLQAMHDLGVRFSKEN